MVLRRPSYIEVCGVCFVVKNLRWDDEGLKLWDVGTLTLRRTVIVRRYGESNKIKRRDLLNVWYFRFKDSGLLGWNRRTAAIFIATATTVDSSVSRERWQTLQFDDQVVCLLSWDYGWRDTGVIWKHFKINYFRLRSLLAKLCERGWAK